MNRSASADNPLLEEWSGPFGGVPPFDRVRVEHFLPALETAVAEALGAIDEIAADSAPPSFENTLAALERADRRIASIRAMANVWRTAMSTPELRAVEGEMMAKLTDYADRVTQNAAVFARIERVHASVGSGILSPEQERLAWLYHTEYRRAGAGLDDRAKTRLAAINQRLAELSTRFDQNVLADEAESFVLLEGEGELAGLPAAERAVAAAAAQARGFPGRALVANTRSAVEPFLIHADSREVRERVWRMFVSRGAGEGERDNRPIVAEILALRLERANLLGYPTHAHWAVERTMAKTPQRALELTVSVWHAALAAVEEELAEMRKALPPGAGAEIFPWDYRYLAERVRRPKCDLDWDDVEPYLQLEPLREAMFWLAGELFGIVFAPADVPVYHEGVRAWSVAERESGRHLGLFYFDPLARPGKKSGAWMNHYRRQQRLDGSTAAIVSNNCNYLPGPPGEPVLLSWSDARTLFHEFGHALHGLLSDVTYPSLAGTQVPPDYVEFPSQILEHWLTTPELLRRFAVHHETGEPIPAELVRRIDCASRSGEGFSTLEALASALVDLRLHLATDPEPDPRAIERNTLAEYRMPKEVAMRHRPPHFGHIFSGDRYAALYYSYLWADVLAADAFEAFVEAGGPYDRQLSERLCAHVLSRGNTVDPALAYRGFRGRDPEVRALLRKRGFADG
jgi:peptidyl-dipeptidase Dcp